MKLPATQGMAHTRTCLPGTHLARHPDGRSNCQLPTCNTNISFYSAPITELFFDANAVAGDFLKNSVAGDSRGGSEQL